jgi:CubicO group peptidase (beta-lactamase class C family)
MKYAFITFCCYSFITLAMAQDQNENTLTPGQALIGSLESDGQAEYFIDLQAGMFVYGEVDQHDVDLKVTVFDPRGDVVDSFDGPERGAEPVQLDTDLAGRYRVTLEPNGEQSGNYTVSLERVEPTATDPAERLDQLLSAFAGDDVPGGIVAVMRDGEIIHSQAVGMANLTYGIPFGRETVSNIGSVSKQFTAFAVTKLAFSGALALDSDVRQYFPELPDLGQTVTIRNLLNHTNGYREFLNLLAMSGVRLGEGDYIDRDELIRILQRQPALQDEPGTKFNYNNTAYGLAALLVERVTDVPFQQWMAENVFEPLGMTNTRVRSHVGEIVPNAAEGYVFAEESPFRQAADLGGGGGATMGPGGIYTTVDDLSHWIENLHTAKFGGSEVIEEITRPQIETPGEDTHYGLGLVIEHHRGLRLIQHGGADTAHRAQILYYPEINAAVTAMSNNGAFSAGSIAREIAEAFFVEQMEPEEESEGESEAGNEDQVAEVRVDPNVFDSYLGKYEFDDYPGVVIALTREEQQIYIQFSGAEQQPVSPLSRTILSVPPEASIEFHVTEDGSADLLTYKSNSELIARRLEDWTPSIDDIAEYSGRYFSDELETFYTVAMGEDGLLVRHRRLDDIELVPKVKDSFNGTFPVGEINFTRDDDGALTGMMVSNVRTQNVRFERQD